MSNLFENALLKRKKIPSHLRVPSNNPNFAPEIKISSTFYSISDPRVTLPQELKTKPRTSCGKRFYMSWYVLYTKFQAEKKAAEFFEDKDIEVYCPLITEVRQWSDRKKKVVTPLFKSYIFVNLPAKERNRAFENPYVVTFLYWLKKPAVVRNEEIQVIKDWLGDDQLDNIEVGKYSPGDEVTIQNGALKDRKAVIQKIGKKRMRLVLANLGFTVNVEIRDVV